MTLMVVLPTIHSTPHKLIAQYFLLFLFETVSRQVALASLEFTMPQT